MSTPSTAHIQYAIEALLHADHAALQPFLERRLAHNPKTIYAWAAQILTDNGPPVTSWEYGELNAVFQGLLALPNRADLADVILALLNLMIAHHHSPPPLAALDQFLLPSDTWSTAFLTQVAAEIIFAADTPRPTAQLYADQAHFIRSTSALQALQTLGLVGDDRAIAVLLGAIRYPDRRFTAAAARALGELRAQAALHPLIQLVYEQRDPEYIEALGELRIPEGTTFLLDLLQEYRAKQAVYFNDYTDTARALFHALSQSGAQQAGEHIAPFLAVPNYAVNLAAAIALCRLGDDRGQLIIREALNDDDLRHVAAKCLMIQGDPAGMPLLIERYQNDLDRSNRRRDISSRAADLHDLSRSGDLDDIPLLEWVQSHDLDQIDQGWSMGEEARRAIMRIQARHQR